MTRQPLAEKLIRELHAAYQGDTNAMARALFYEKLAIVLVLAGACLVLGVAIGWLARP